jgi:hypothetical protein
MTSRPHDLNGEEPARNDHRGDRAERHLTIRGCAARGGFGASSIRQPQGALNSMTCTGMQRRARGTHGAMPVMMTAVTASLQLTTRGGLVSEFFTGDPVPFPGVINALALS